MFQSSECDLFVCHAVTFSHSVATSNSFLHLNKASWLARSCIRGVTKTATTCTLTESCHNILTSDDDSSTKSICCCTLLCKLNSRFSVELCCTYGQLRKLSEETTLLQSKFCEARFSELNLFIHIHCYSG